MFSPGYTVGQRFMRVPVLYPSLAWLRRRNANQERRKVEDGKLKFNGLIKWRKGSNTPEWSTREKDARTEKLFGRTEKAVFTKSGTQATNVEWQNRIVYFASLKQRSEQFQIVREVIIDRLWQALIDAFSYPTME
jgi:hypothetical protein